MHFTDSSVLRPRPCAALCGIAPACWQRKRLADEKRTAEEAELAARLAYEARAEFEKEEAERKAAKEALKAFLLK